MPTFTFQYIGQLILIVYFQELGIDHAIGLSNQQFLIETLIVFMLRNSIAHEVTLDKGFNFH